MRQSRYLCSLLCLTLLCVLCGCSLLKSQKSAALTYEERQKLSNLMGKVAPPPETSLDTLDEYTPDTLRDAYAQNPLQAEKLYGNRWLRVRGAIKAGPLKTSATTGIVGYALVLEHKGKTIACVLWGQDKEEQLLQLKNGESVTLVGKFLNMGSGPVIILCSLVPSKQTVPAPPSATVISR